MRKGAFGLKLGGRGYFIFNVLYGGITGFDRPCKTFKLNFCVRKSLP